MPDINLLKNTEKYDPTAPKAPAPNGPGPLSDPSLAPKGIGGAFRSFFSRRPKIIEPAAPTLGKAMTGGGKMNLGRAGGDRILNEKKSKPTMLQLPEEEAGGFNVNLLGQDAGQVITVRRQLMKLLMVAVGGVVMVALVYVGLSFYNNSITSDIDDTTQKISALGNDISTLQKTQLEVESTTKKISAIRSLIDRHVHWTKFFSEVEKATSPEVFYGTTFTGDLNGAVTLSARAPSFDAVATQYLYFQQAVARGNFIQSFEMTGAVLRSTKTGNEVTFTVNLQLVPSVFYQTVEEAKAAGEVSTTSQTNQDSVIYICVLQADPTLLATIPASDRPTFQAAITTVSCPTTISDEDTTRLATESRTDADQDGLNAFLERVAGTSDTKADTDGDGVNDLEENNQTS